VGGGGIEVGEGGRKGASGERAGEGVELRLGREGEEKRWRQEGLRTAGIRVPPSMVGRESSSVGMPEPTESVHCPAHNPTVSVPH